MNGDNIGKENNVGKSTNGSANPNQNESFDSSIMRQEAKTDRNPHCSNENYFVGDTAGNDSVHSSPYKMHNKSFTNQLYPRHNFGFDRSWCSGNEPAIDEYNQLKNAEPVLQPLLYRNTPNFCYDNINRAHQRYPPHAFYPNQSVHEEDRNASRTKKIRTKNIKPRFCTNCGTKNTPSWRRSVDGRKTLCNACGLYQKLHGRSRPFAVTIEGKTKAVKLSPEGLRCNMCDTTNSMSWKKGRDGKLICLKCYTISIEANFNRPVVTAPLRDRTNFQNYDFGRQDCYYPDFMNSYMTMNNYRNHNYSHLESPCFENTMHQEIPIKKHNNDFSASSYLGYDNLNTCYNQPTMNYNNDPLQRTEQMQKKY